MTDAAEAAEAKALSQNESIDVAGITRAVLLIAFAALVFVLATTKMWDPDVGWHLRIGQYILRTKSLQFSDIYSWTRHGAPWYDTEWLFNVLMYLVYAKLGVVGVTLAKAAVITVAALVLFFALEEACGNYFVALLATDIVVIVIRDRFTERPQMFTYLFIALVLLLLLRFRNGKKSPLWLIPPLVVFWVNVHAGAVLGAIIVVLFAAAEAFKIGLRRLGLSRAEPMSWPELRPLAIIAGLATVGLLLTPNTYHLFDYIVRFTPYSAGHISEHAPLSLTSFPVETSYTLLMLGLAAIALFNFEIWEVFLAVSFGVAAFTAIRFVADLALVAAPMFAIRLRDFLRFARRCLEAGRGRRFPEWTPSGLAVLMLLAMAVQAWHMSISPWNTPFTQIGLGVYERSPFYPIHAVKFLNRHDIRGRMYNGFALGGYFIWHEYPRRRVFFDGRLPIYSSLLSEAHATTTRPGLIKFMDRYRVDFCVLQNQKDVHSTILFRERDWALVFWDDVSLVYLRRRPSNARLIKRFEYHYARPYLTNEYVKLSGKDVAAALRELTRASKESPVSTLPHLAKAQIFLSHNLAVPGIMQVVEAQTMDPSSSDGDLVLGLYLMGRGSRWQAQQKFQNLGYTP